MYRRWKVLRPFRLRRRLIFVFRTWHAASSSSSFFNKAAAAAAVGGGRRGVIEISPQISDEGKRGEKFNEENVAGKKRIEKGWSGEFAELFFSRKMFSFHKLQKGEFPAKSGGGPSVWWLFAAAPQKFCFAARSRQESWVGKCSFRPFSNTLIKEG